MSISTAVQTQTAEPVFMIVRNNDGNFYVTRDGVYLSNRSGTVRVFTSRSSARKHITRERRGIFS